MGHRLRKPKIHSAPVALILAVFLTPLLVAACLGGTSSALGRTYQGAILQLTLEQMFSVPEVAYTEEDQTASLIKPSSEGNELVVIRARIGNHAATTAQLNIDAQPAELRMDTGRYFALNTAEVKVPADGFYPDKDRFTPFIRGSQELEKDFELDGWLVFDVPKGSKAESLKWEAGGDIIIIDL